ncbi:hypothetical protein Val02_44140 [Virgisporangium aliadipatigenens]|uniref:DUF1707 domain-containing protein n=1 Tax=Virgisporangium aliadipatigenens TaxID=741659 RepID=A0A8J3YPN7_9ACTN|nr:DUF1707 domain-containing protein [Virgisporangium aliadipatigenens]GIJ47528.1 hypothetical protein Val02_44140 [Virgisporangium aliadipatigenens]
MTDEKQPHRVRASDPEREQYAELLRAAMSEGRLSMEEGEERLARVYAAVYRDELSPQVDDLPGGGWTDFTARPEYREEIRKHVRWHGIRVTGVALVVLGVWAVLATISHVPVFPLILLAIFLLMVTRGRRHRYHRWQRWQAMQAMHGAQPPWAHHGHPWHHHGWERGDRRGPGWRR